MAIREKHCSFESVRPSNRRIYYCQVRRSTYGAAHCGCGVHCQNLAGFDPLCCRLWLFHGRHPNARAAACAKSGARSSTEIAQWLARTAEDLLRTVCVFGQSNCQGDPPLLSGRNGILEFRYSIGNAKAFRTLCGNGYSNEIMSSTAARNQSQKLVN